MANITAAKKAGRGACFMKKVCFFSGDITRSGGTERASSMVANGLAREGRYEILFLSLTEQAETPFFELDAAIRRHALEKRWIKPGAGYLKVVPKLRRFLKDEKIDVIVDIDIVLDALSIPASAGLKTKVVSWEHFNYGYEMTSRYRRLILKYSVKRSSYVVTLTEEDRRDYMERAGRRERIAAIYNPMQETARAASLEKKNRLITVGGLVRPKGLEYLAQVAKTALAGHPDWKWLVIGEGEERPFLEDFIKKNGLEGQLVLTGRVRDVGTYLSEAKIYVMTSRREGLPMSLLEAKAYGLPSVAFNVKTGPDEIIKDGVNGYLIKPFDIKDMAKKLDALMEDDALRERLSSHARDDIDKFRLSGILKSWNGLLEQVTDAS